MGATQSAPPANSNGGGGGWTSWLPLLALGAILFLLLRPRAPAEGVTLVTGRDAERLLREGNAAGKAVLLDVRSGGEYAGGHVRGALNIPVGDLAARARELPKTKGAPLIVYCRSGARSASAAGQLVAMGYTAVYDMGASSNWPHELVR